MPLDPESIKRAARKKVTGAVLRTRPGQALKVLVRGPDKPQKAKLKAPPKPGGIAPGTKGEFPRLQRRPDRARDDWPAPPEPPAGAAFDWSLSPRPDTRHTYDVEYFEQLNKEYASKPLVPRPRNVADPAEKMEGAQKRLNQVAQFVDLQGKSVLELGCGQGQEVWLLRHGFDCRAYGIDVTPYPQWMTYRDDGVNFNMADAAALPFADNSLDRIVSFAVYEHIPHPYTAIAESTRALKPGGIMWIYANLHRGPSASHRYRQVYFPWSHLLFTEDVFAEWYERQGRAPNRPAWVNKCTYETYAKYFNLCGLELMHVRFSEKPWDEDFYQRHIDVLGRYPVTDLKRDFFTAVLRKPE